MMSNRLIIVSTTLYRNTCPIERVRGEAASASLEILHRQGVPCILVDGGSSEEFLQHARAFKATVVPQDTGTTLGAARRQAIAAALRMSQPIIGYSELEKTSLFSELEVVEHAFSSALTELVIPARRSLDSYPPFQRRSEARLNRELSLLTGHTLDYAFGPRFWKRELSKYFLSYTGEYGDLWESIFIPVQRALRAGCRCIGQPIDFSYPAPQLEAERADLAMQRKRIEQYVRISEACWAEALGYNCAGSNRVTRPLVAVQAENAPPLKS